MGMGQLTKGGQVSTLKPTPLLEPCWLVKAALCVPQVSEQWLSVWTLPGGICVAWAFMGPVPDVPQQIPGVGPGRR